MIACKCGKQQTEAGLGQGYFDKNGYHYQCPKCFKKSNPKYFKAIKSRKSRP